MKIPENHNTKIDKLLSKTNEEIFISDWNSPDEFSGLGLPIINKALSESSNNINKYFFIDEMQELKKWFSDTTLKNENINIMPEQFSISSNGTATAFLTLHILNNLRRINAILISPIYFSYINLLKEIAVNIEYIESITNGQLSFDFTELEDTIKKNNSNLILINDPLFGAGISFGYDNYNKLFNICENYNVTLIIDYIYGGMEWNEEINLFNSFLINHAINSSNVIFIESISKRLFLNGAKNSIIFSNSKIINMFEQTSTYTIGCLTNLQISLFKEIYNILNKHIIINKINENTIISRNNFEIIGSLVLNTDCFLSACNSGYYCLFYIPKNLFNCINNMQIAEKILYEANSLTIPHDRYLHFCNDYYCFRINLTTSKQNLLISINSIINSFNN